MITPEPNPPYDWIATLVNFLFLGLAGALGAVVRHTHTSPQMGATHLRMARGCAVFNLWIRTDS